jgi:hypothetical protein
MAAKPKKGRRTGPYASSDDNARRVLTGAAPSECVPTADPFDRAHCVRGGDLMNRFVPAADIETGRPTRNLTAKPRLYPRCYMTGAGVSTDSMWDRWWLKCLWLQQQGVELGGTSRSSIEVIETAMQSGVGKRERLRDLLHQRTRQRVTRRQAELERQASELLRQDRDRRRGGADDDR